VNPVTTLWYRRKQQMYANGRRAGSARFMNRWAVRQFGLRPFNLGRGVVLEVRGRSSGRVSEVPLVVLREGGERYLVSMLGTGAGWVLNVRADEGRAVLRDGRSRDEVTLVDVPLEQRPALTKRYLDVAPGARPHIPVDRRAPVADFAAIAADYPVFRVSPRAGEREPR
jgi:hypothetical protein